MFCSTCGQAISPAAEEAPTEQVELVGEATPTSDDGPQVAPGQGPDADGGKRRRRRMLALVGAGVGVVVLVAAALAVTGTIGNQGHTINGTWTLTGDEGTTEGNWDSCSGTGGYDDFTAGTPITIRNGEGNIVGSGDVKNFTQETLELTVAAQEDYDTGLGLDDTGDDPAASTKDVLEKLADATVACVLYFTADVDDADYYTLTLSRRGDISFSRADLEKNGWWVALSLGG